MIHSPAQYEFVKGDIADIRIDGGILPLRGDDGVLRGEDICFLYEANMERWLLLGSIFEPTATLIFTKRIEAKQLRTLITQVKSVSDLTQHDDTIHWLYNAWSHYPSITERKLNDSTTINWYEFVSQNEDIFPRLKYSGDRKYASGDAVSSHELSLIYDYLSKLNTLCDGFNSGWNPENWVTNTTGTYHYPPGDLPHRWIYRYSYYSTPQEPETDEDYIQTISSGNAEMIHSLDGRKITFDKISYWAVVRVGKRTVKDWIYIDDEDATLLLHVDDVAYNGQSRITLDLSRLSSQIESKIQSLLGWTKKRPTPSVSGNASEYWMASVGRIYPFLHLRDKTKWY